MSHLNTLTSEGIAKQLGKFFITASIAVEVNEYNGSITIFIERGDKKSSIVYNKRTLTEMDSYYYFSNYSFCMHVLDDVARKIREM